MLMNQSPIEKTKVSMPNIANNSRFLMTLTPNNENTLAEIMKEEYRQAIVREEDSKYQLQLLQQQFNELQKQQTSLFSKLELQEKDIQKYQQIAQVQKERCQFLTKLIEQPSKIKTEQNSDSKQSSKKRQVSRDALKQDELVQELQLKITSLRKQIQQQDAEKEVNKKKYGKLLGQRETEIQSLKQRLNKLEQLYNQKLDQFNEALQQQDKKLSIEKNTNRDLREKLDSFTREQCELSQEINKIQHDKDQLHKFISQVKQNEQFLLSQKQKLTELITEFKERIQILTEENHNLHSQLEECYNKNRDQRDNITLQLQADKQQLSHQLELLQQEYQSIIQQNQQLQIQLKIFQMSNEDLSARRAGEKGSVGSNKASSRLRYFTDQSDLPNKKNQQCQIVNQVPPILTSSHKSRHSEGFNSGSKYGLPEEIQKILQGKKISTDQTSPTMRIIENGGSFPKRTCSPSYREEVQSKSVKHSSVNRKAEGNSQYFFLPCASMTTTNSLKSCFASQLTHFDESNKENYSSVNEKTLDQLQKKYLDLRNRIYKKSQL